MSTDHQLRDQLVAAAAQPHQAPDLDEISHRAQRRRARRRTALVGGTGIVAAGAAAVVLALPPSITGPTIDEQQPPPIALLAEPAQTTLPSGTTVLDRLDVDHDPGRARTIEHGEHMFIVATAGTGTLTCLYANPTVSRLWTGGCKPTSSFLDDGWLLLTIRTDEDATPLTAILTRDDVTSIRTPTGSLGSERNVTVTTSPAEGLTLEARQPTTPLPRSITDEVGTMVR